MSFLPKKLVDKLSHAKDLPPIKKTSFRIGNIQAKFPLNVLLKTAGPLLDRLFGTYPLHCMYHRYKLWRYDGIEFLEHFLPATGVKYIIQGKGLEIIPQEGKALIIGNHPHGGIEGVILSYILNTRRTDYKLFVNIMLYFVKELTRFFIFTNPMLPGSVSNAQAIRKAQKWLSEDHCLVIFPAGRVGLYREDRGYITDESWDRMALSLSIHTDAPLYPIFIDGQCSKLLSWSCRLFFPMKLLMLVNEFLKSFSRTITFYTGNPILPDEIKHMKRARANAYLRMRTYLLAPLSYNGFGNNEKTTTKDASFHKHKHHYCIQKTQLHQNSLINQVSHPFSASKFFNLDKLIKLFGKENIFELKPVNFWTMENDLSLQHIQNEFKHNSDNIITLLAIHFEPTVPEVNNSDINQSISKKAIHLTALWLFSYLRHFNPLMHKTKKSKFLKKLDTLYKKSLVPGILESTSKLHNEVLWFFSHYWLNPEEAETMLYGLEEKHIALLAQANQLKNFHALALAVDENQNPVLLLFSVGNKIKNQKPAIT